MAVINTSKIRIREQITTIYDRYVKGYAAVINTSKIRIREQITTRKGRKLRRAGLLSILQR